MANNRKEFIDRLVNEVSIYAHLYGKETSISIITAYGANMSSYGTKSRAKNANNIFAVEAGEYDENVFSTPGNADDTKYKKYDSLEASVEDYVKNYNEGDIEVNEVLTKIIETYELITFDESTKFIAKEKTTSKEPVVEEIKEEVVESITVESNKNVIDVEESPSEIDTFMIRNGGEQIAEYPNTLEEAINIANQHPGYTVSNSKGITLYTSPIPTVSPDVKQNCLYTKGRRFSCKAIAVYVNPTDTTIYRTITGTFALYDGIERNGKFRVCNPKDLHSKDIRKAIIGWVAKENIV